jgi:C4-dicarboxylate transporter DctQ subunit
MDRGLCRVSCVFREEIGKMNINKVSKLNAMRKGISAFDKHLSSCEKTVSALMLLGIVLAVLAGIVMRFVLQMPNMYGEEISRYLFIGCIFIGVSIGVREKAHLGIDSIVKMMPEKVSKIIQLIADMVSTFVYIVLTILAFRFIIIIKGFGQSSPAMIFLPMYGVYSLLFLGFILSSLRSIMMLYIDYCHKGLLK